MANTLSITSKNPEQKLQEGLQSPEVPKIYANGVIVGTGAGDMMLFLERNGEPVAILNLSYTLAKSLTLDLSNAISSLEAQTGNNIMTISDVNASMNKNNEEEKNGDQTK